LGRLKAFVRNYSDLSDDKGFQFEFYCDICGSGYRSRYKRYSLATLSTAASIASRLLGGVFSRGESAAYAIRDYRWHQEHDKAFYEAMEEAITHFKRCPSCNRYVCASCWNDAESLCVECAPRVVAEVAKARARVKAEMAREAVSREEAARELKAAAETLVTCPRCGKPTRPGNFCELCGAPLKRRRCPSCGAEVSPNARFCPNCGTRLSQ